MIDTKIMEEVTMLHDLGHTMQSAKAMETDVENAYFINGHGYLSKLIDEAEEEIKTGQQDTVYIVIKISRDT